MKHRLTMIATVGLTACSSLSRGPTAPPSMIEGIAKSNKEKHDLTDSALKGDATSALRLAYHYLLVENDRIQAMRWFRVAAKQGGAREKEIYRSFLEED